LHELIVLALQLVQHLNLLIYINSWKSAIKFRADEADRASLVPAVCFWSA
jgi:hypothetical protein